MRRTGAIVWHASFSVAAAVLYFFFVLPRWYELVGQTSPTLGTALRIVTGVLIGLAALPVVLTLLRTRRPEFGTPQLALTLRMVSIALHVVAGVLIVGTAVSEIWLDLDGFGQWLFGVYGAAAAIALLGIFAFYLAFVAELPPPPPKPLKPKKKSTRRRKGTSAEPSDDTETEPSDDTETEPSDDTETEESQAEEVAANSEAEPAGDTPAEPSDDTEAEPSSDTEVEPSSDTAAEEAEETAEKEPTPANSDDSKLRNRRPSGKNRKRRRLRGGVVVED